MTKPEFKVGVANDEEMRSNLPNIQKDFWINLAVEKEFGIQPGDKIFDNEVQIFFIVDDVGGHIHPEITMGSLVSWPNG